MEKTARYGVLNVVVHPHPDGAYRKLFEIAGKDSRAARYHGDRFATLSPVSSVRNGVFTGKLATWTEIDPESNMIDKASLKERLLAESDIEIPEGVGFNSRVFSFAFREGDHKLFVELLNDEGQTISAGRARLAFSKVLQMVQPFSIEEMDVHVVTESNAVEHVLGLSKIRRVEILLDLPNPDHLSKEKKRVLDRIQSAHAKRVKTELTKSAGEETLVVEGDYLAMAELAKDNGYLIAKGRDELGEPAQRSTKSYPMEIKTVLSGEESRSIATRRIAETRQLDQ